jgi:MHS family proline/betaine transporter-like MFS transporter
MGLATLGTSAFFLLIMEAFPQRVRATALAVIYSVGVTIFGGFAQFNVTWLLHRTGDPMSPAWYLLATGSVSLLALWRFTERRTGDASLTR